MFVGRALALEDALGGGTVGLELGGQPSRFDLLQGLRLCCHVRPEHLVGEPAHGICLAGRSRDGVASPSALPQSFVLV